MRDLLSLLYLDLYLDLSLDLDRELLDQDLLLLYLDLYLVLLLDLDLDRLDQDLLLYLDLVLDLLLVRRLLLLLDLLLERLDQELERLRGSVFFFTTATTFEESLLPSVFSCPLSPPESPRIPVVPLSLCEVPSPVPDIYKEFKQ